mmetsp:Transcript_26958/g.77703  ORF Transcript_26958/g.77703 Transcript_26958/m.77703 type:complete len:283 (-) Transcript_26958:3493-4341(-)
MVLEATALCDVWSAVPPAPAASVLGEVRRPRPLVGDWLSWQLGDRCGEPRPSDDAFNVLVVARPSFLEPVDCPRPREPEAPGAPFWRPPVGDGVLGGEPCASSPAGLRTRRRASWPTAQNFVSAFFLRPGLRSRLEGVPGASSWLRSPCSLRLRLDVEDLGERGEEPGCSVPSTSVMFFLFFCFRRRSRFRSHRFRSGMPDGGPLGASSACCRSSERTSVSIGSSAADTASSVISEATPGRLRPRSGWPSSMGTPWYRSSRSESVSTWCRRLSRTVKISCTS